MGDSRFGLENLSEQDQVKTDGDSALILKQLALYKIAKESETHRNEIGFLLESPRDPATFGDSEHSPTFWNWPEVLELLNEAGMKLVTFDQGKLGHPQVKPTSCVTNLGVVKEFDGLSCTENHGEGLKTDLGERMRQTSSWSCWAPGLKGAIRASLLIVLKSFGIDDGSLKKICGRDQSRVIDHSGVTVVPASWTWGLGNPIGDETRVDRRRGRWVWISFNFHMRSMIL